MSQNTVKKYKLIPQHQIDELTAIYDDYLYISRFHEKTINVMSLEDLADAQKKRMNTEHPEAALMWCIKRLTPQEEQDFANFINNNVYQDGTRTYVILKHIKSDEDKGFIKRYAIPPYKLASLNMQLPSPLERYTIAYPTNCTLGDTTFYIDGLYKAVYTGPKANRDRPLTNVVCDMDMLNELYMVACSIEALHKNNDIPNADYNTALRDMYVAERLIVNENIVLECLGSFAGKILDICRELYIGKKDKYTKEENREALEKAEQEGLIPSANDFQEYVNIRHFLRHQWDTLDGFGYFSPRGSNENKNTRREYVASYVKLCDQSVIKRMKAYIEILHQMQHVISTINTNRIIRHTDEPDNKFIQRVLEEYLKNLNNKIYIELNYPLVHTKYKKLYNRIYTSVPVAKIIDEYFENSEKDIKINDYIFRSYFLQSFNSNECLVMRHCQIRGRNMKKNDAWEYLEKTGFLSATEAYTWKKHSHLRNLLSHNYFDDNLRKQLSDKEETYDKDLKKLSNKLGAISPDVIKLYRDVYEYTHPDGLVARLDYKNSIVLYRGNPSEPAHRPIPQGTRTEKYSNGISFDINGRDIIGVKLPNGIIIHLDTRTINWDEYTYWHTNSEFFNTLHTAKSKLTISDYLRVTEYTERNNNIPFRKEDTLLIDNRHRISLDYAYRIQDFNFVNAACNVSRTEFMHTEEGYNVLFLSDGTIVLFTEQDIVVRHSRTSLTFDNRRDFAATYIAQQNAKNKVYQ